MSLYRLFFFSLILFAGLGLGLFSQLAAQPEASSPRIVVIDLEGPIGPAVGDFVKRSLQKAADEQVDAAVLRMNTPGGLDSSMRDIIQAILDSPLPVISYVAPTGARAASAGTYILYASHVAAMAPSTNLGAATPVQISGGGPLGGAGDDDKEGEKAASEDAMGRKIVNDAVAYIRGLAELHGRNAEWAEESVREGASLTSSEALEKNVIDIIAEDLDSLLSTVDGRTVKVLGKEHTMHTADAQITHIEADWRTKFLTAITHPNVVYILMLIGVYGIIFELANPGSFVPGIIGTISLLIAFYAFQVLPVSYVGVALILFGMALMVAEAFVPSFGVLGIGGLIAFVFGSILLFDTDISPGFAVSPALIAAFAILSILLLIFVLAMILKARKQKVVSGAEEMIGSMGTVKTSSGTTGYAWIHSELWKVRSPQPLQPGQQVRVTAMDGLTLEVESMGEGSENREER
ncbi:protein of unknown function DUF107 [Desulfurispirillum indicum S5]|uniref:Uncharacterized protein n=1 Tax=Desulfurispirillum indicum (strain ATCC BAA-1389 / DSM 22839 / S5) TaxID=653733 RepID=E6W374_DESIS|nr:nodulation protein NfeD [Desulfurispirillum indicum]ADU66828.1 protein of unknown function DUF107 [Desulfurispirillum indicum S5]